MAVNIADIETGLLAAIQADETLSGYLRTLESYSGQLEHDLGHLPWRFPAVFVMFSGAQYKPLTQFEEEADFTFSLLCVAQTLRGNATARRGSESAVYHLYMHKDAGLSGILMPSRQFLDRF